MKWIYHDPHKDGYDRYDSVVDSCCIEGTESYHEGCHPAIFIVVIDDGFGIEVVRCYDCLEEPALSEINKDMDDWFDGKGKYTDEQEHYQV